MEFQKRGYKVALDKSQLQRLPNDDKALGVFHANTMSTVRSQTSCRSFNISCSGSIETSIGRISRGGQTPQTVRSATR